MRLRAALAAMAMACALVPARAAVPPPLDWFQVREGSVMAQELGHNFGRKHVNCGSPDNVDNSYPYPPCQLDNAGAANYYGFDVRTQTPIRPEAASDFMSYGPRNWVSDYTWRALFNSCAAAGASGAQVGAAGVQAPLAGNVVFAAGYIDMAINQGQLNHLLVLPDGSELLLDRDEFAALELDVSEREQADRALAALRAWVREGHEPFHRIAR